MMKQCLLGVKAMPYLKRDENTRGYSLTSLLRYTRAALRTGVTNAPNGVFTTPELV